MDTTWKVKFDVIVKVICQGHGSNCRDCRDNVNTFGFIVENLCHLNSMEKVDKIDTVQSGSKNAILTLQIVIRFCQNMSQTLLRRKS